MAQTAAHLVERVIPWVPTRQWVVPVPVPLRYWMAASQDLTAKVHTIIRTTIGQYYVNRAVARGCARANIQPGSVTFIQRFGSAINLNLHCHCVFLEGVYFDRTDQDLKPRFVQGEPPSDTDIAAVVQKISRRVIRTLRQLGYLEVGLDAAVATGYDPLGDDAPELARTLAASVQQRIAFGERAGQQVRRMGSGFGAEGERPLLSGARCASVHGFSLHANTHVPAHRRDQLERLLRYTARGAVSLERLAQDANGDLVSTFTHPWSDGTTGIRLSPMELLEKLAALVPLPRVHLVRYGGCLAPHSHLRGAIIPTPRQQGVDEEETDTGSPRWAWARLLKRVFALDMARCPFCQQGALRIIAAHHAGRGDPHDPPASEARSRPTPDCSGAYPPRSLCLVRRLTAPGGSLTRPRQLSSGPAPAIPPLLLGAEAWPSYVLPTPPARPAAARMPYPSPWQRPARPSTPARVCTRLSLHDSAQQEPSAVPPALQELFSSAHRFFNSAHRV